MASEAASGGTGSTELLPLFPLGTVLVPEMVLDLHVFEPRYRQLVTDLLGGENPSAPVFGVVALRRGWEVGELRDVHQVGTSARVTDIVPHPDGRCDLSAVGERRFEISSIDRVSHPYLVARVRYLDEPACLDTDAARARVMRRWESHVAALTALALDGHRPAEEDGSGPEAPELSAQGLSYAVAQLPSLPLSDRQRLLSCTDVLTRLAEAARVLRRETVLIEQLSAVPATATMFAPNQGQN